MNFPDKNSPYILVFHPDKPVTEKVCKMESYRIPHPPEYIMQETDIVTYRQKHGHMLGENLQP